MARGKKLAKVELTPLQEQVYHEKVRICRESGWAITQENFDKIELWDMYGRIDNYRQGVIDTWGKWNNVNNKILQESKPCKGGMNGSEINRLQREVGIT